MRDFTLQNMGEAPNTEDVATKEYVDNSVGGAFEVRNGGYNAKGHLYIGGQKIGGVRDPINDGEAANKRYVEWLRRKIKRRKRFFCFTLGH